jgi:MFS family permease
MGWTSPLVLGCVLSGVAVLGLFAWIETHSAAPMFDLSLFRIRTYTFGVTSSSLASLARGGLMFMLIIWLQGIWLPTHGYSFESAPLWAGICLLPLTAGLLISGPASGYLSDRFDRRIFATGGMIGSAIGFALLESLPIGFGYKELAVILFFMGLTMGAFIAPNRASLMNSLPARHRGAGAGMNQTFQNSAQVLSIGIFFTLMIIGLSATLPHTLTAGLQQQGVPASAAAEVGQLPPISVLFASFLGYDPATSLIPARVLQNLPAQNAAIVHGHGFFANLITGPFRDGLHQAFTFAMVICLIGAAASWSRGTQRVTEAAATQGTQEALDT